MPEKKYNKVAVGGTFDKFHEGHRLLVEKAFQIGDKVLIGVTSDEFGGMKEKSSPVMCECPI
jgi:pantetheine-phosphate adenylyltransferase